MKSTTSDVAITHRPLVSRIDPRSGLRRAVLAGVFGIAFALCVLTLAQAPGARGAGPWYVATTGLPGNNCLTAGQPCDTLQRAITLASAGDSIFVASGTYTGASNEVAVIDRALTLSGGWNAGFTSQTGTSTIDGQNQRRGLTILANSPTTLNGFTIQNGLAVTGTYTTGAGVAAGASSPITLTNVSFINNTAAGAGAGLLAEAAVNMTGGLVQGNACSGCYGAGVSASTTAVVSGTTFINNTGAVRGGGLDTFQNLTIQNAWFQGNTSTGFGGAVYGDSAVTISDSTFYTNTAGYQGGAIFTFGSATFTRLLVSGNVATDEGGGLAFVGAATLTDSRVVRNQSALAAGGGIVAAGPLTLVNTDVLTNTALTRGGGISAKGDLSISASTIRANTSDRGGGIAFDSPGSGLIEASEIVSNTARMSGGGLLVSSVVADTSDMTLDNVVLAANAAPADGDDLAFFGLGTARVTGRHNTFAAGVEGEGTGVSLGSQTPNESLQLTNSIFHGYAVGVDIGSLTATTSLTGVLWSNVTVPTQTANSPIDVSSPVTGAAAFVDAAGFDFHLSDGSAAFNQGIATALTTDIDGETRPLYGTPDLGADELNLATNLVLVKNAAPALAKPGDAITFTLAYTNAGARIAYTPVITDVIVTAALTDIAVVSSGATITPTGALTYSWQVADLAPGAGGLITVTARIRSGFATPATITNTARIDSWVGDTAPVDNSDDAALQIESPITGLQAQNDGPKPPNVGVAFTATVTTGSNVTYAWNFGDGATGTGASASHGYGAIGAYTATVTATNPLGTSVVTIPVTIADIAITGLTLDGPTTTTVNRPTAYTAAITTGSNVTYAWTIDGAAVGTGAAPYLVFTTTGSHTVTVTATNSAGSQSASQAVTVALNRVYLTLISR